MIIIINSQLVSYRYSPARLLARLNVLTMLSWNVVRSIKISVSFVYNTDYAILLHKWVMLRLGILHSMQILTASRTYLHQAACSRMRNPWIRASWPCTGHYVGLSFVMIVGSSEAHWSTFTFTKGQLALCEEYSRGSCAAALRDAAGSSAMRRGAALVTRLRKARLRHKEPRAYRFAAIFIAVDWVRDETEQ